MSRRVAVYGGSFDPPHAAHLLAATWVLRCAPIDELLFVPTAEHALGKRASASFDERCAMLELVAAKLPGASVSRIEASLPTPSRTLNTLEALMATMPEATIRLVVGADIAEQTRRWHRWEAIELLAPPLWIGRVGHIAPVEPAVTLPNISSTAVRAALRDGASVEGMLQSEIREFIDARALYRGQR